MDGTMRHVRTPNSPEALRARLAILESRETSLLIRLADLRLERDALKLEVERLQSDLAAETWRRD